MLYCEGPSVPHTLLYSLQNEEVEYLVQNNTALLQQSSEMAWPQVKDFKIKLGNGFVAFVRKHALSIINFELTLLADYDITGQLN